MPCQIYKQQHVIIDHLRCFFKSMSLKTISDSEDLWAAHYQQIVNQLWSQLAFQFWLYWDRVIFIYVHRRTNAVYMWLMMFYGV